jgi:hypothetical protein
MASVPLLETAVVSRWVAPAEPSLEECGTGGDLGDRAGVEVSRTWLGPPALSPSNSCVVSYGRSRVLRRTLR